MKQRFYFIDGDLYHTDGVNAERVFDSVQLAAIQMIIKKEIKKAGKLQNLSAEKIAKITRKEIERNFGTEFGTNPDVY